MGAVTAGSIAASWGGAVDGSRKKRSAGRGGTLSARAIRSITERLPRAIVFSAIKSPCQIVEIVEFVSPIATVRKFFGPAGYAWRIPRDKAAPEA